VKAPIRIARKILLGLRQIVFVALPWLLIGVHIDWPVFVI
jgi:hypothetical protein